MIFSSNERIRVKRCLMSLTGEIIKQPYRDTFESYSRFVPLHFKGSLVGIRETAQWTWVHALHVRTPDLINSSTWPPCAARNEPWTWSLRTSGCSKNNQIKMPSLVQHKHQHLAPEHLKYSLKYIVNLTKNWFREW